MIHCLTNLYSYQQQAVDKILLSRVGGLFMEMGTGKTRCAIELVALRQERINRVVWFCPVSLKTTIAYEIRKHTDSRDICIFDADTTIRTLPRAFWYIVGIESMSSSDRVVLAANRLITTSTFVIVDESSYIKGHCAKRTERITQLSARARYRLILTGTPLSQGVVDLYAQMKFLSPKILGYNSFYSFAHNHLEYSDKYRGMIVRAHNVGWLAAKIHPYTYQVTKAECLDLPRKIADWRGYKLSYTQREAYEQAKWEMLMEMPVDEIDSYVIFKLFTALQQIVSGFWNRQGQQLEFPHERLDILLDVIRDIPADAKVIIWCKFVYSIQAVTAMLQKEYGPDSVALYYGKLSEKERDAELARFRQSARFFVATQSTGGHGLTLNEAHYVVFYENGFKYSERLQAEDRCHRIGQMQPVTYVDITATDSIDERIRANLAKKQNVVRDFKHKVDAIKNDKRAEVRKKLEGLVKGL
jgi:SNF2 family DNA or RNA helicase